MQDNKLFINELLIVSSELVGTEVLLKFSLFLTFC